MHKLIAFANLAYDSLSMRNICCDKFEEKIGEAVESIRSCTLTSSSDLISNRNPTTLTLIGYCAAWGFLRKIKAISKL